MQQGSCQAGHDCPSVSVTGWLCAGKLSVQRCVASSTLSQCLPAVSLPLDSQSCQPACLAARSMRPAQQAAHACTV